MKNLITKTSTQVSSPLLMSTLEVARLTGKNHSHVIRDVRTMLEQIDEPNLNYQEVMDARNYTKEILLEKKLVDILLAKYKGLARVPNRLQEEAALKTIEQLLGITLIRQYAVLDYRVDGYHVETNTCYEIDEPEHKGKILQDLDRQNRIEKLLKCTFVRIKL